jgi:hypothetical protein
VNRWKAASIHLGISAVIATVVVVLMSLLWYPGPYFTAMGGSGLLLLIVGCDVVLGPLITLIIFKSGKKGLKLDLTIIGCIQIAALAFGAYTVFIARPVFTVFVVDRFEVVAAADIRSEELAKATDPMFSTLSITGPRVVAARLPDKSEGAAIALAAAGGGEDVKQLPRFYVPYEQARAQAAARSRPLDALATRSSAFPEMMKRLQDATGKHAGDLGFLPMSARNESMSVVVDRRSGEIVDILPINPW